MKVEIAKKVLIAIVLGIGGFLTIIVTIIILVATKKSKETSPLSSVPSMGKTSHQGFEENQGTGSSTDSIGMGKAKKIDLCIGEMHRWSLVKDNFNH